MKDRVTNMEGLILGVLAEHSLPFTAAPVLVDVAKELSKGPHALNHLSLSRQAAGYKIRLGLGKALEEQLVSRLKKMSFSLNIEKAMSNNHQKIRTCLVSHVCTEKKEVVIEYLASLSFTEVNSRSLHDSLCKLFNEKDIPWTNLMSILMDSCAIMRGSSLDLRHWYACTMLHTF